MLNAALGCRPIELRCEVRKEDVVKGSGELNSLGRWPGEGDDCSLGSLLEEKI